MKTEKEKWAYIYLDSAKQPKLNQEKVNKLNRPIKMRILKYNKKHSSFKMSNTRWIHIRFIPNFQRISTANLS